MRKASGTRRSLNGATGGWCGSGSQGTSGWDTAGVRIEEVGWRWETEARRLGAAGFARMPSFAGRPTSKIGAYRLSSISC